MSEKNVTMAIIGAGGCGINVLASYMMALRDLPKDSKIWSSEINPVIVDTSASNIDKAKDEQIHPFILGDAGAGKNRASLLKDIQSRLDASRVHEELRDINIIVYSMSGGSGSVIGPLLVREALRQGKAVISIGVVDACSKMDCVNSINTMQSLGHIASTDKVYIPTMIYSNVGVGRFVVNRTIATRIWQICDLFLNDSVSELDYTDRMNFLRPDKVGLAEAGVYTFCVVDVNNDEKIRIGDDHLYAVRGLTPEGDRVQQEKTGEEYIFVARNTCVHSAMVINDTGVVPEMIANATYLGMSDKIKYIAICGAPFNRNLIDMLNTKADRYERSAGVEQVNFADAFQTKGGLDKSGIIN